MTARPLDAGELLSIDVDAEVRKLGREAFASDLDRLVELARVCVRLGASRLELRLGRSETHVRAPGAAIDPETLEALRVLGDARAPGERRHAALVSVEAGLGLVGLSLASAERLSVRSTGPTRGTRLERRRRGETTLAGTPAGPAELAVDVALGLERAETRRALARAFIHARLPITIDGQAAGGGPELAECFVVVPIDGPGFTGRAGLPRAGRLSRTTLVQDEVVTADTYGLAPDGIAVFALARLDRGVDADEARPRIAAAALEAAGTRLYPELARTLARVPPGDAEAARRRLVERALGAGDAGVLGEGPIVRTAAGRWLSWRDAVAAGAAGAVWAIAPGERVRRWAVGPDEVLVLDSLERDALASLAGLACCAPPPVGGRNWPARLWSRIAGPFRTTVPMPARRGAALAGSDLVAALAAAIDTEIGSGRFVLPGVSPELSRRARVEVRRRARLPLKVERRGGELVLGLGASDARVRRLANAFAAEPACLPAVLAVVFGGHDGAAASRGLPPAVAAR